jgi:tRNA G18 (ribose-2'-O)-methylase SpoU
MRHIVLIAHNVRSCHNVGSLLRTAEGLGVATVYLTGYTPYPSASDDERLPYLTQKNDAQIHKSALGAEQMVTWKHNDLIEPVLDELRTAGFIIAALEQQSDAVSLPSFQPAQNMVLIVGREVEGIETEILAQCDTVIQIPMLGRKESFNVSAAAAMALYHLTFTA